MYLHNCLAPVEATDRKYMFYIVPTFEVPAYN